MTVKTVEVRKVNVSEVKFRQEFYPRAKPSTSTIEQYVDALRAGDIFPPIELDADGLILLDGYHRWKAHQEAGLQEIDAQIVSLNGTPRILYAAGRNSLHGDRLSMAEKKAIARQMAEVGVKQTEIKDWLKVSAGTVSGWVSDITQRQQRGRNASAWWLGSLGWIQEEVASHAGVLQPRISESLSLFSDLKKAIMGQYTRGRTPEQIAETEGVPVALVEVALLDGKDDDERLDYLKISVPCGDVWTYSGCDPRFGADYPGRIPGQMVAQLLYFYTQQGDIVVDPMVGSGTTIDVCAYMGRRVYGYDAHPCRDDIIEHDFVFGGWPERTRDAALIFWDPPYFKKKDEGYGEKSISRLDKDNYLGFFDEAARSIPDGFSGRLAFLCSDYDDEYDPEQNVFFWDYVNRFIAAGWRPERRIQAPLSTQQVAPFQVTRLRKERKLARLGRDLVIMRRGYG